MLVRHITHMRFEKEGDYPTEKSPYLKLRICSSKGIKNLQDSHDFLVMYECLLLLSCWVKLGESDVYHFSLVVVVS